MVAVLSKDVVFVKGIAALGTEPRRILRVFGLPTAFITLVKQRPFRLLCAAVAAELALVHCSARTGPAFFYRLWQSTLTAELTGGLSTATT